MTKTISAIALAAMMSSTAVVPVAEAGARRHHHGHHAHRHYRHHHGHHHRGRGHWRNGKWIALGILGAAVGAAIADADDCYYRHGRRYCR